MVWEQKEGLWLTSFSRNQNAVETRSESSNTKFYTRGQKIAQNRSQVP